MAGSLLVGPSLTYGRQVVAELPSFELRHGVLVDAGRAVVYLGDPNRGIEAVDLATGRSRWRSGEAALPLALHGRLLAAQGEEAPPRSRLLIAIFDTEAGGRRVHEAVVALPSDVRALVNDELGRSFRASATYADGGFLVSWSYKETQILGVARPPGEPLPERTASGTARVDFPAEGTASDNSAARRVSATLPELTQPAWHAGRVRAAVRGGHGDALTLERWDAATGKRLPDRVLLDKALVALPSVDQRHLLASERVGTGGPHDPEYRWSLFSLETGEKVGEARREVSAAPFFVWKECVVFVSQPYGLRHGAEWIEEPLKIRAIRLAGGEPIWDRAVRDLEYRGTTPPAR